jgi:hypothetical protein
VDFVTPFLEGGSIEVDGERVSFQPLAIDDLVLTSGQIVACDPLVAIDEMPFTTRVPPGRYPVTLSIAKLERWGEGIVYARIQFQPDPPVRWELAMRGTETGVPSPESQFFESAYSVDSGRGCFMDADAFRLIAALSDADIEAFNQAFIDADQEQDNLWVNMQVVPETGANLLAFMSGIGDGLYESNWGYAASGEVVCLVTDFNLY